MRQFDICRNPDPRSRNTYPYLLVLQHDLLGDLKTVVVAPLVASRSRPAISRLNPQLEIAGHTYSISTAELAAILKSRLGEAIANVSEKRTEIISAIDILFTGV